MIVALTLLVVMGWPAPAAALSFELSAAQRLEAIRVGERSVTIDAFGAEWLAGDRAGQTVTVLTPFHRVAVAARQAAFRRETLKPGEIERVLREQRGRLVLWVQLRGDRETFARFYAPRLVVGEREIKPAFVQNEHTAARQPDGRYLARCLYGFPTQDLTGVSRVALVVADAEGRDVSRFAIDLATMR